MSENEESIGQQSEVLYSWRNRLLGSARSLENYFEISPPTFASGFFAHGSWKDQSLRISIPPPALENGKRDAKCKELKMHPPVLTLVGQDSASSISPHTKVSLKTFLLEGGDWKNGESEVYRLDRVRDELPFAVVVAFIWKVWLYCPPIRPIVIEKADMNAAITPLYGDLQFSDVQLVCSNECFNCNQVVLGAHSDVFKQMFRGESLEAKEKQVQVKDANPVVLKLMLEWMYGLDINNSIPGFKEIIELFQLSDRYLVDTLKRSTTSIICDRVNAENAFEIYLIGDRHSDEFMKSRAAEVMKKERRTVFANTEVFNECFQRFPTLLQDICRE